MKKALTGARNVMAQDPQRQRGPAKSAAGRFGRALLGAAYGLATGSAVGTLLGIAVALAAVEREWWDYAWFIGAWVGATVGSACGLLGGWTGALLRRRTVTALLSGGLGAALGGIYAAWVAAGVSLASWTVPLAVLAGALDGLAVTAVIQRLKRQWAAAPGPLPPPTMEQALDTAGPGPVSRDGRALQQRIRRAGTTTLCLRLLIPALLALGFMVLRVAEWGALAPMFLAAAFFACLPVSFPAAIFYRAMRRRKLRQELLAMPRSDRECALAALDDPGMPGAYEIAAPLIREFGTRSREVAPAAAPSGSAREVSAPPGTG